jgi:hypothetical protein
MCRIILGLKSITARIVFSVRCAPTRDARHALSKKPKNTEKDAVKKRRRQRKISRKIYALTPFFTT